MSLLGPTDHDKQKLHAEITQIVNQRVVLTIFAFTIFGVITAWIFQSHTPIQGEDIHSIYFWGSMLILIMLLIIFYYNHILRTMLRTFTSYLVATDSSNWELDWQKYRTKYPRYIGYTRGQTIIYFIIGLIAWLFPYIICYSYSMNYKITELSKIHIILGLFYLFLVLVIGIFLNPEKTVEKRWVTIKNEKN